MTFHSWPRMAAVCSVLEAQERSWLLYGAGSLSLSQYQIPSPHQLVFICNVVATPSAPPVLSSQILSSGGPFTFPCEAPLWLCSQTGQLALHVSSIKPSYRCAQEEVCSSGGEWVSDVLILMPEGKPSDGPPLSAHSRMPFLGCTAEGGKSL